LSDDLQNDPGGSPSGPGARWRPDADVVTQLVEGETVVVHLQTNEIYALNRTATRAWELLASGSTKDEARAALQSEFDVPPEQLSAEIDALVAALVEKNLLRPAESDA
jgi:coenzyme PQQ synthesis protein D (PqqD)